MMRRLPGLIMPGSCFCMDIGVSGIFWKQSNVFFSLDGVLSDNYNIIMETIRFEWDERKNEINISKHGIAFAEAKTVFYDAEALVIDDPEHSGEEERFIILGFSRKANLLVVCHCYRASDTIIRIISARKATVAEARQYHEF